MMYEVRKYKAFGEWSAWKKVDEQTAMHKMQVVVKHYDDEVDEYVFYCPYQVRKIED